MFLSVGNGSSDKPFDYNHARNRGAAGWIFSLIDILMSGNAETVSYRMNQIFNIIASVNNRDYFRLDPMRGMADSRLDNATSGNMMAL